MISPGALSEMQQADEAYNLLDSWLAQKLRQLRDIHRDPLRLSDTNKKGATISPALR
jgi:hypothetical protein